jgi:Uma2 family endonuclease
MRNTAREDLTVDDLADLSRDLRYELIAGRLVIQSRTPIDQSLVMQVLKAIDDGVYPDLLAVHSLSLSVDSRNEPRPTGVVIDPRRGNANRSPVPIADAVLVVDLVTPSCHLRDLRAKATAYVSAGLPRWWVVNPFHDGIVTITEYRPRDGSYEILQSTDGVFTTTEPFPVRVDLPALASWRNKALERARPAN